MIKRDALLSLNLKGFGHIPPPEENQIFSSVRALPNEAGYVMTYAKQYGDGKAIFFNLCPGAMLIKFEGKYQSLELANEVAASNFIDSRVFSLRISERGTMHINRNGMKASVTPGTAVWSCYDGKHPHNRDIVASHYHTFNHFLFNESGLQRLVKKTIARIPSPISIWMTKRDISTYMHSFTASQNLKNFARSLNLQSLSYPNNLDFINLKYRELFYILENDLCEYDRNKSKALNGTKGKAQGARNLVEKTENYTVTATEAAKLAGLSRSIFNMSFYEEYQETFADFVRRKKFQKAVELLEQNKSLSEIVSICGFTEASNFSRAFKNYYGVSPAEFKKSI